MFSHFILEIYICNDINLCLGKKILLRFGSLLACESFHADVHAGNLWLLRDGRIGFLDFGMLLFSMC